MELGLDLSGINNIMSPINEEDLIFSALEEGAIYNITADGGAVIGGSYVESLGFDTNGGLLASGLSEIISISQETNLGGLLINGIEDSTATYNTESLGGISSGGEIEPSLVTTAEATGGTLISGSLIENLEDVVELSGGVFVSGSAHVSSNTALILAGSADISFFYNVVSESGVLVNGFVLFLYDDIGIVGALAGGNSDYYVDFDLSGGINVSGLSDNYTEFNIEIESFGVTNAGSSEPEVIGEIASEGGALAGGYSEDQTLVYIGDGSILASGSAEEDHIQYEENAVSVFASGTSDVFVSYLEAFSLDSAGVLVSGVAEISLTIPVEGGISVGGSSPELKTSPEIASGGVSLGGTNDFELDYSDFVASGGMKVGGKARSEKLKYFTSNRNSFSRASVTPNILNAEPENPNKLIDPVGAITPEIGPQSLRGIPEQSYCIFEEACVDDWPKLPKVVLKRLGKYAPPRKTKMKKRDLTTTLNF
jgi:hypothetical protein